MKKRIAVLLAVAVVFISACDLPVPQTQPPTVEPSVNTNLVPSVPTEQAQELVDETEKNCRRVVANFVKRRHGDAALVDLKILKIAARSGESYRFNYQVWVSGDLENKDVGLDERCSIISAPEPLPTSTPTLTPCAYADANGYAYPNTNEHSGQYSDTSPQRIPLRRHLGLSLLHSLRYRVPLMALCLVHRTTPASLRIARCYCKPGTHYPAAPR